MNSSWLKKRLGKFSENLQQSARTGFYLLSSLVITLGLVFAANSISIPTIEFGAGVADIPDCLETARVDFSMSSTADTATISEIQVGPIGSVCAGQHVRVTLEGSSATVIRQITWQLASTGGPFTVSADDTQIGTPAIAPEDVISMILEISETPY